MDSIQHDPRRSDQDRFGFLGLPFLTFVWVLDHGQPVWKVRFARAGSMEPVGIGLRHLLRGHLEYFGFAF